MDNDSREILISFAVGVILTVLLWILIAERTEISKVKNGYLTLRNKTYTVTLYDVLDVPEKKEK